MPSIAAYQDWETAELYCPICASVADKMHPNAEPIYSTEIEEFTCSQCKKDFKVYPTWDDPGIARYPQKRVARSMMKLYIWGTVIAAFGIFFYAIFWEHTL